MEEVFLTIGKASEWASRRLGREVTPSNLSYLVNYGRIRKAKDAKGTTVIDVRELDAYYNSWRARRETEFKSKLGADLNWRLSFEEYKEAETTKHVHRLHPYKGKFIPQLAEYFLNSHTDEFKTSAVFKPGDTVLDPFCGSGTTLVQANELGMHAIGADVSEFNAMMTNLKLCDLSPAIVERATALVVQQIAQTPEGIAARAFDAVISKDLKNFNDKYFPSPKYKYAVRMGKVDESKYGTAKEQKFLQVYRKRIAECGLLNMHPVGGSFLETWYFVSVRREIAVANKVIQSIKNATLRDMLCLILSRTIRTCRATTHKDLATLREPVCESYYCDKHGKICKPLLSMLGWWKRYAQDTVKRLTEFSKLKTNTQQMCIAGDARNADLPAMLSGQNGHLAKIAAAGKIRGIFSSPPYVGLINYHEQHAYAYELFQFKRREEKEIGLLEKGTGKAARDDYVSGVADVLLNSRRYLVKGFDVFLVANDKFGLYPIIAKRAGLQIVREYKRPVINRAEGNKGVYSETIFHMRGV